MCKLRQISNYSRFQMGIAGSNIKNFSQQKYYDFSKIHKSVILYQVMSGNLQRLAV